MVFGKIVVAEYAGYHFYVLIWQAVELFDGLYKAPAFAAPVLASSTQSALLW